MILGIGSDMTDIRRIESTLARHGERFTMRVFTVTERAKAERRKEGGPRNGLASTYAKRFAAKEAVAKALGTGFRHGVYHRDIGVINLPSGRPTVELKGGAALALKNLMPPGLVPAMHLTLGDEYPYAQAWVIIEGIPGPLPH